MRFQDAQYRIYLPIVREFCNEIISDYYSMWKCKATCDVAQLQIPFCTPEYGKGIKVFFLGQDTYNTDTYLEYLYECYKKDDYQSYFNENNKWVNNYREWYFKSLGNPYSFWGFIVRLQLAIYNHPFENLKINEIIDEKIFSFGWGNVNPLELLSTVKKYKIRTKSVSDYIKKDKYEKLLEKSKEIAKLKYILNAYDPKYIFILTWNGSYETSLFDDLEYNYNENDFVDGIISTYSLKDKKVIWINHPQSMMHKKQDYRTVISKIIERM